MVRFLLLLAIWLAAWRAEGAALPVERVPEPLKPWVEWALHGQEEAQCPMAFNDAAQRICQWPSGLTLRLEKGFGRFVGQWRMARPGWVPLPGSADRWPQEVKVDGKATPLLAHDQTPGVWLAEGEHQVSGVFYYTTLPDFLTVPPETGLVNLNVEGTPLPLAMPDPQGRLWLRGRDTEKRVEDRLEMNVHRLVRDGAPLTLETRIELRVAGKRREVRLDPSLREGWIPLALETTLPARMDGDGRLRLQVRSGVWEVTLRQRHAGPVSAITLPRERSWPWPEEEAWAFAARHDVRLVNIAGVEALDARQTRLPQEWREYPVYRVRPGEAMRFEEQRRGAGEPPPDQLNLTRHMWLDFDGGGWTFQDLLQGSAPRATRLEMNPPMELGRVEIDGENQFITRRSGSDKRGVELRNAEPTVRAEGRLPMAKGVVPATGWDMDLQKLSVTVHLPPGWRLLHAAGADATRDTWLGRWTLLDIFLVLMTTLVVSRLWGRGWGGIALTAMVLVHPEQGEMAWLLLAAMAGVALGRAVGGEGRWLPGLTRLWRLASLTALLLMALPFLIGQIRTGLYPQLEMPHQVMPAQVAEMPMPSSAPPVAQAMEMKADAVAPMAKRKAAPLARASNMAAPHAPAPPVKSALTRLDPSVLTQTGPGLPQWEWRAVRMIWSGPVERGQELRLHLLSPMANRILIAARVGLLLMLLWRVAEIGLRPLSLRRAGVLLLVGLGLCATPAMATEIPDQETLETLKSRLLEPPECLPVCADLARLRLEADGERLRLHLELHAVRETAVPLPGQAGHWLPGEASLDGRPAPALRRRANGDGQGGTLWMGLPAGVHAVVLEGPLPSRETVQIPLPMPPRRVSAESKAWRVEGLRENGTADASLQLRRNQPSLEGESDDAPGDAAVVALPPFVEVERLFDLGLTWEVVTRVRRVTRPGAAVMLEWPVLPGETVTAAGVRVVGEKVLVRLEPEQTELEWRSTLDAREELTLRATEGTPWSEVWRLRAGPMWHVVATGIPATGHADEAGARRTEWRPWPGETVGLRIGKPEGVAGPTLTLEKAELEVTPGERATDARLTLQLRASRGGQHAIRLPEGAVLLSARIDGREEKLRLEGDRLVLPIAPGLRSHQVVWRQPGGLENRFVTPRPDLGLEGVNLIVRLHLPPERWILWTWGPAMGPAVLYWGSLVLILLVALALGRVAWLPLRSWEWMALGVGLSMVEAGAALVLAAWFPLMGWRGAHPETVGRWRFNLRQMMLFFWTLAALAALAAVLRHGLLGYPDMWIVGNRSSARLMQWYQDRGGALFPVAGLLSLPIFAYRVLMLVWSLWLATAMLGWIRWGWSCYATQGLWRHKEPPAQVKEETAPAP
ncbi:MAG: hypothetical protein HQM03_05765 [Magnetococcales bacterium]|nr:hypothetical protein [Magnetococcales bacterium]